MSDDREHEHDLDPAAVDALADAIVAFFHALSPAARREYDALADADRRFGEDVAKERGR